MPRFLPMFFAVPVLAAVLTAGGAWSAPAPRQGEWVQVREMDVYFSERLDLVNRSGRVLDLRDVLIDTHKETIALPGYTWLPNYTVRLWLQAGPKNHPMAPNEMALLLDRDVFDNNKGIITLKHKDYGVLGEAWYGGKGIWDGSGQGAAKAEDSDRALIPFDKNADGPPPLPGLSGGGFEYVITAVRPVDQEADPQTYLGKYEVVVDSAHKGDRVAEMVSQTQGELFNVEAVIRYPAVHNEKPVNLPSGENRAAPCTKQSENSRTLVCGPLWWPEPPFKATVLAVCARKGLLDDAPDSPAMGLLKKMVDKESSKDGGGGAGGQFDCAAPKQVTWP